MKTPKIINAIELIDNELIENANKAEKKPFYIKPVFKRATAIAACLVIVAVTVFALTNKTNNDITSDNSSKTSSQNKKVIYVTGDEPDDYTIVDDSVLSLNQKFIAPKLQEKMDSYKDYTDAEVVYRVVVEIFVAKEDNSKATELIDADEEVQLLYNQYVAAHKDFLATQNSINSVTDEKKQQEILAQIIKKENTANQLRDELFSLRDKLYEDYFGNIIRKRFEDAAQFSEKEPVATSYDSRKYYMDLTGEEINTLAEKGGYIFRLSFNDIMMSDIDQ